LNDLKVEKAIREEVVSGVGAIYCYCGHIRFQMADIVPGGEAPAPGFQMASTVERGEAPKLKVKRTTRGKTGAPEVEIVFKGQHHHENLSYYRKDPAKWDTFGNMVMTPEKARELGNALIRAGSLTLLDFKPMVVSLGELTRTLSHAGRWRRAHGRIQRPTRRKNS
jgi:hypothetical protein